MVLMAAMLVPHSQQVAMALLSRGLFEFIGEAPASTETWQLVDKWSPLISNLFRPLVAW